MSSAYTSQFPFTGGRVVKVLFVVADDVYMDIEQKFAAALPQPERPLNKLFMMY